MASVARVNLPRGCLVRTKRKRTLTCFLSVPHQSNSFNLLVLLSPPAFCRRRVERAGLRRRRSSRWDPVNWRRRPLRVFGSHPLPPHGSIPSAALHTGQGLLRRRTHTHSRGDVSCYLASEAFEAPFHPHAFSHTVSREKWLRAEDEIKPECVTYFKRQMWVLGTKPPEKGCQLPSNQQRKLKKKDKIELTIGKLR